MVADQPQARGADVRPLSGVRVLDLSRVVSGPYAGRVLGDLGADVVKVEPPDGDLTDNAGLRRFGRSGMFAHMNAGKRNVGLDLDRPGAPELVRRLAKAADVVIENFRPSVMPLRGLGWSDLSALNPRLIMLSISGFGSSSPYSERRAFAPIVHAESGLLIRHAQLDGRAPSDIPLALGDVLTSLHGAVAVMAALRLREVTGRGEHIDMSMLDAMVASDDFAHFAVDAQVEPYPTQGSVWPTVDGPLLLAGNAKHVWASLSMPYGLAADIPSDSDLSVKIEARRIAIERWFCSFATRGELIDALDTVGLVWAELTRPEDVLSSPGFQGRPIVVEPPGPESRPVVRTPYRMGSVVTDPRFATRRRGADNTDVMRDWLGLADGEIDDLVATEVLISRLPTDD